MSSEEVPQLLLVDLAHGVSCNGIHKYDFARHLVGRKALLGKGLQLLLGHSLQPACTLRAAKCNSVTPLCNLYNYSSRISSST